MLAPDVRRIRVDMIGIPDPSLSILADISIGSILVDATVIVPVALCVTVPPVIVHPSELDAKSYRNTSAVDPKLAVSLQVASELKHFVPVAVHGETPKVCEHTGTSISM
ncbi:MAG: hypothetical protein HGB02_03665 [Chlorobiaceae bacterium]|nr:hypothetical protein [Chlorobiaceae bacterium]